MPQSCNTAPRRARQALSVRSARLLGARILCVAALAATAFAVPASAADKVVARVNGIELTEKHMRLAASEIGVQIATVPQEQRNAVLIEFLIENQLFAQAAKSENLGDADGFGDRVDYYRNRALRDAYFDKSVMQAVTDADAKALYDREIGARAGSEEMRARHILVKTEAEANDVIERLNRGDEFAALAKELSQGPSKTQGGDLGYFGKGQMVKPFEAAILKLKKGEVSEPVQTQFGWHVIKLEDRRIPKPPAFGPLKDRIKSSLIQRRAQTVLTELRDKAKIEFVDKALEEQVNTAARGSFGGGFGGGEQQ